MLKLKGSRKSEKGFTLIELLVVAAIIGILLALAIPNLIKARMSANEANARKSMQTLRDAEGEYFEQDLDDNGDRDYTGFIATNNSLRDPDGDGTIVEEDALVDNSFTSADAGEGSTDGSACTDPKAGYCISWDSADPGAAAAGLDDFGWRASMTSWNKTGRRDYAVYGDGVIRCTVSTVTTAGNPGMFDGDRTDAGCD